MAYLALARKYRPQNFEEVLSQDFIISTLLNAINMDRVAHAYLFTGPRGVGKTSTARIFAKALNCLNPVNGHPCGTCENCIEIADGTALDMIEIDGASNRGVEEIRSLRDVVKYLPVKSKKKIIIVDEVHMLTEPAFNALLKTLEEPPSHIVFIFATTDQHKIPVTILSRCQRFEFKKIGYDEMYSNLTTILEKENITYEKEALIYIIRNSDGCMRDSLSLLDQIIAFTNGNVTEADTKNILGLSNNTIIDELFSNILNEKVENIPEIINNIEEKGLSYKFVTESLIEYTRNMLMIAISGSIGRKDLTENEEKYYESLKSVATTPKLYTIFQILQKLVSDMKYSDFIRYMFEFAIIKAASYSTIIPLISGNIGNSAANNYIGNNSPKVSKSYNPSSSNSEYGSVTKSNSNLYNNESKDNIKNISSNDAPEKTSSTSSDAISVNPNGLWVKAIDSLNKTDISLSKKLTVGQAIVDDDNEVVLNFENQRSFYFKMVNKSEIKNRMEELLSSIAGHAVSFSIRLNNKASEGEDVEKK